MTAALPDDRLSRGRARVEERPDGLAVEIPARRRWFLLAFSLFWSAIVVTQVLPGSDAGGAADVAGRVVFGSVVLVLVVIDLWMLLGRQRIELDARQLRVSKVLGPLGRSRSFERGRIDDLRASVQPRSMWSDSMWSTIGLTGGNIAFDYGARTHRFGGAVDEAEAKQIARRLQEELR